MAQLEGEGDGDQHRPLASAFADDVRFGPAPLYARIKRVIRQKIAAGEWPREERIPSENELVRDLKVSRMTVNRALRELTRDGMLVRMQGVGTFVAPAKPESSILEIRNIADDIHARGHEHVCDVVLARKEKATEELSKELELAPGAAVFHTICIHRENGSPVQIEDRHVNPEASPDYLDQNFSSALTPTQFLNTTIPATEVKHVIEAIAVDAEISALLRVPTGEPCLRMTRTTWAGELPVTFVRLVHPGSRYRLVGRFMPSRR